MMVKKLVWGGFVGALVLTAHLSAPGARGECPEKSAQVDVSVSGENKISIPQGQQSVTISLDQAAEGNTKVCWVISGLKEDYTLVFETKEDSEEVGTVDFNKTFVGQTGAVTLDRVGVPGEAGTWVYAVKLDGPGEISDILDPEVIIEPGPGGSGGGRSGIDP